MFEKDKETESYTGYDYTLEENLYQKYIDMRKAMHNLEQYKYSKDDPYIKSEDFKQGFLAGVKIMSSMLLDI